MKRILSRLRNLWAQLTESKSGRIVDVPRSLPVVDRSEQSTSLPDRSIAEPAASGRDELIGAPTVPRPRYERTLVVGVDFGTSTTKVAWQDLSESYFELFRWRLDRDGLESVLFPSTVRVGAGMLAFGDSDANGSDAWLPSIKLCVLCSQNHSICRCRLPVGHDGWLQLPGLGERVPALSVASLFLANVFREVELRLRQKFYNDNIILIWNVGCPMDHLDIVESKAAWERMVGVAMQMRDRVTNPTELCLVSEAQELAANFVLSPDSNFFIQPEGMAAVKAFLESPRGAEEKTYAIVDVGAGTTEVSFFFNGRARANGGNPRPSYLADSTEAIGGGKIDIELAEAWHCDVETARRRKEKGEERVLELPSITAIRRQYGRTCQMIMKEKRLIAKNDKRFDLFIIGGSSRLPILNSELSGINLPGGFVRENTRQLTPPRNLRNARDVESNYALLANACGLASSLDWEYYPPREVGPLLPPRIGIRSDRDDLYAK